MVQLDAAKIAEMERTLVMAILLRYRATSRGKYATTKEYVLLFAVECLAIGYKSTYRAKREC